MEIIYCLYWLDQGLVYIGRTNNLNTRLSKHRNMLKTNSHYNYKLQKAYNLYGDFETLIVDSTDNRDTVLIKENAWIDEFNSIDSGLNLMNAFTEEVPKINAVLTTTIKDTNYKFLFVGPNKEIVRVNNLAEFCRKTPELMHSYNEMVRVHNGKSDSCKGYTKLNKDGTYIHKPTYVYKFTDKHGNIEIADTIIGWVRNTFKDISEKETQAHADKFRKVLAGIRKNNYLDYTCEKIARSI